MAEDRGNGLLRQGRRTNLDHLRVEHALHVLVENRVLVGIVDLNPTAARPRPGQLLADPLHGDGRHVADQVGDRLGRLSVVHDIVVNLIGDNSFDIRIGYHFLFIS